MQHPQLTLRSLRARAVDAPLANPIRTAVGEVPSAPLVLLDIFTDEGVTGRSYLFAYTPVTLRSLVGLLKDLEPELVGQPVAPFDRMRQLEMRFRLVGWQGLIGMSVGAIDMALWDALGCAAEDAQLLERSVQSGFRAVKIKIGGGSLAEDVRIVRETRRIIGPDVTLMVDYNQSLTVTDAIARVRKLAEYDLAWVEEPSAHVLAVMPTAHWLEYLDIAGAVLTERLLPQDGTVTPRGPGLGITWDEDAVRLHEWG